MSSSSARGSCHEEEPPVWRAVKDSLSVDEVRRVIEAQGTARRRAAAVNRKGPRDETPLQAALSAEPKRGDLAALLLEHGADTRWMYFNRWDDFDEDDSDYHQDPDKASRPPRGTALMFCITYNQLDSVRALLRAGHDPNERIDYSPTIRRRPFCTAVHFCLLPPPLRPAKPCTPALAALEILVREGGADVNARDSYGETPLFWIPKMYRKHEAALDLLIRLGADVNAERGPREPGTRYHESEATPAPTPLLNVMKNLDANQDSLVSFLRKLVAAGARVSGVFSDGGSPPLAFAAELMCPKVVRFLLEEAGAPVDERNPQTGQTALHVASKFPEFDYFDTEDAEASVTLLLDGGADPNAADHDGCTPLSEVVMWGEMSLVRLLLERGATADVVDNNQYTPLMLACAFAHERDVMEALLRASSPGTRRAVRPGHDGESALDMFIWAHARQPYEHWQAVLMLDLLTSGAPVLPRNVPPLLRRLAAHGLPLAARREAELAARRSGSRRWRAHDDVVGLALDAREAKEMEEAVAAAERRVDALELELRGMGTDGGSESASEQEEGAAAPTGGDAPAA